MRRVDLEEDRRRGARDNAGGSRVGSKYSRVSKRFPSQKKILVIFAIMITPHTSKVSSHLSLEGRRADHVRIQTNPYSVSNVQARCRHGS